MHCFVRAPACLGSLGCAVAGQSTALLQAARAMARTTAALAVHSRTHSDTCNAPVDRRRTLAHLDVLWLAGLLHCLKQRMRWLAILPLWQCTVGMDWILHCFAGAPACFGSAAGSLSAFSAELLEAMHAMACNTAALQCTVGLGLAPALLRRSASVLWLSWVFFVWLIRTVIYCIA